MTIRTIKFALLISAISIFGSCSRLKYIHSDSYIMDYSIYDGIKLDTSWFYTINPFDGKKNIRQEIHIKMRNFHKRVNWESEGGDYDLYHDLCIKHNDISYDRKVEIMYPPGVAVKNRAIYPDLVSISVTCESDFDTSHPAGSELNDIMEGRFISSFLYVQGGYKDEALTWERTKPLNEITAEDLCMLKWQISIYFTAKPEKPDKKLINVTALTNEGSKYSDRCVFDFSL